MSIIKDFFKYSKRRVFNYVFKFLLVFALMYIGSLVMYIPNTFAEPYPTWYFDNTITQPKNMNFYQFYYPSGTGVVSSTYTSMDSSHWFYKSGQLDINNYNGIAIVNDSPLFLNSTYMYSAQFYLCSNMDFAFNYGLGTGNDDNTAIHNASNYTYILDSWLGTSTDKVCKAVTAIFSPSLNDTRIISLRVLSQGATKYGWFEFYGMNIESLGQVHSISSADVQNIVNNSGLATANSVSDVQTSLNQVKKEISGMQDEQKKTNQQLKDMNDSINNDDTTGAKDTASSFFTDFTTDTHGLTAIITAPLKLIKSITSTSCKPLVLPLPFVDKDLTLPCMSSIYSNYFGSFLSVYQLITFGIVAYWVCVRIFNLVKDFKNPDHDEIEVLDL